MEMGLPNLAGFVFPADSCKNESFKSDTCKIVLYVSRLLSGIFFVIENGSDFLRIPHTVITAAEHLFVLVTLIAVRQNNACVCVCIHAQKLKWILPKPS